MLNLSVMRGQGLIVVVLWILLTVTLFAPLFIHLERRMARHFAAVAAEVAKP